MSEYSITAYPLSWPAGQPRSKYRSTARFKTTPNRAMEEMLLEVERMGGRRIVVSTNVELRQDGLPYANRRPPTDPGVAVYFNRDGRPMCIACDQYSTVHDNMRAIGKTIEALRGIERWGGKQLMDRAFTGFAALPAPMECAAPWYEVLGVTPEATEDGIRTARVSLARRYHPDSGSEPNEEKMKAVNAAAEVGLSLRRGAQGGAA